MISCINQSLLAARPLFAQMVVIAADAVGKDPDLTLSELEAYALRGASCILARDGDMLIGYLIHGPAEKFLSWVRNMPLLIRLRAEGLAGTHTACHVHLRKAYWKTGTQLAMSRAMAQAMLDQSVSHLLLYGYATDQLASYALSQPGGRVLQGIVDVNGRKAGVRDLAVYLEGTMPLAQR